MANSSSYLTRSLKMPYAALTSLSVMPCPVWVVHAAAHLEKLCTSPERHQDLVLVQYIHAGWLFQTSRLATVIATVPILL